MGKQQVETTIESIHPDLISQELACTNVLVEKEINEKVSRSKGRNVYMVPFFNFIYYLGYFPMKFHFDKKKDQYYIKTHRIQQVFFAISQTYTLSMLTYYTCALLIKILSQDTSSGGEAIQIFEAASNAGLTATSAFSIYNSWKRRHLILEVVERTRVTCVNNTKLRIICAVVYGSVVPFLVGFGIIEWLLTMQQNSILNHDGSIKNLSYSTDESVFQSAENQIDGKNKNFFDIFGTINDMNSGFVVSIGKVLIIAGMFTYLLLYYSVCQALFMLLMLTVKQTGNEFRYKLKLEGYKVDENGSGLSKGMELYRELNKTTKLIKKVFGNSIISYYIATVAYLAVAPHALLGKQGNFERMVVTYSAFSFLLWIIAAEFHHQVRNSVLKWTEYHFERENISTDNRLKLFSISHDISSMESTNIAVANKCFAVTYTHLCSMFSLIVTYGIIVFQLHHGQFQATKHANQ